MTNINTSLLALRRHGQSLCDHVTHDWPILSVALVLVCTMIFLGVFLFVRGTRLMERQLKQQLRATTVSFTLPCSSG